MLCYVMLCYVCMYVCMYVRMYVCICLYVYVYVCMYVYLYIYTYMLLFGVYKDTFWIWRVSDGNSGPYLTGLRILSFSNGWKIQQGAPESRKSSTWQVCVCVLMMLMFSSLRDQIRISSFFDTYGGVLSHRATPSQKIHRWDLPIHNNHPAIGWPPWLWKSPYIFFPMLWVKDLHSLLAEVDELTKRRSQGYQRPGWDCGTMVGQWDNGKVTELVT